MTALITQMIASHPIAVAVGAGLTLLMALIIAFRTLRRVGKLAVGTAVVQAGVTAVVVTGTYLFATEMFHLTWWEATTMAVFLEAATWVTVGMVYDHARNGGEGFGPAGPFFWLFSALGGLLAVIAGRTPGEVIGRAVIVVFGACLWYLQLCRVTTSSGTPGKFRWTPRRMLIAVGAVEPGDADVVDANREWQVRRLARSMRWANGRPPWSWLGRRGLVRLSETTREHAIVEARRRYAVGLLVVSTVHPESAIMRAVLADVSAAQTPGERPAVGQQDGRAVADSVAARWPALWPLDGHHDGQEMADGVAREWPAAGQPGGQQDGRPVDAATAQKELTKLLRRGKTITRSAVMDMYGTTDGTAGRWLAAAKKAATAVNGNRMSDERGA
jgi:hypothetical protein